jgi:hypothetical protein
MFKFDFNKLANKLVNIVVKKLFEQFVAENVSKRNLFFSSLFIK